MNEGRGTTIGQSPAAKPPVELGDRTKAFALRIIRLSASLPRTREADVLARQVLRSGTSVGAHWREAHRARSTAEFISKIDAGLMELGETAYWLELLVESKIVRKPLLTDLLRESDELTRILVASSRTAKARKKR